MRDRADDCLRFACDLRVPSGNNQAEQVIRMSKLRIKVSGCMRSMPGADVFCAIRSYAAATAARHGTGALDALTRAAEPPPGSPSRPDRETLPASRYRKHIRNYKLRQIYPVTLRYVRNGVR